MYLWHVFGILSSYTREVPRFWMFCGTILTLSVMKARVQKIPKFEYNQLGNTSSRLPPVNIDLIKKHTNLRFILLSTSYYLGPFAIAGIPRRKRESSCVRGRSALPGIPPLLIARALYRAVFPYAQGMGDLTAPSPQAASNLAEMACNKYNSTPY